VIRLLYGGLLVSGWLLELGVFGWWFASDPRG
jgi:hypothetical protein